MRDADYIKRFKCMLQIVSSNIERNVSMVFRFWPSDTL